MLELRMTTDLETALPAEIGANFDELKVELQERLHSYSNMVVTEDAIQAGKNDLATLRKLREAIETRRKDVKKRCEVPYKSFERRVKELTALIDKPIVVIDSQIKQFEEQERKKKREAIAAIYKEHVPDTIRDIIPLERIFDPTWLNKATSMKKITEDIETRVTRTNVDLVVIAAVGPEFMAGVRAKYAETLDITAAMEYQKELQKAAELFRQQEEATERLRAIKAAPAEQVPAEEKNAPQAAQEPATSIPEDPQYEPQHETLYSLRLAFQLTKEQANALKAFLNTNHIQYTKI